MLSPGHLKHRLATKSLTSNLSRGLDNSGDVTADCDSERIVLEVYLIGSITALLSKCFKLSGLHGETYLNNSQSYTKIKLLR